jgi:50S ribosomal protein L16 3-hydroxylase
MLITYNQRMKKSNLLGDLTPAQFLRDYWHKKPLLIRQAFPGFKPLISRDELFGLAAQDDVESRLITHFKQQWELQSGPFESLPALGKNGWTMLVQGVNLHHDEAEKLLRQFNFIPDARLDDLMISYATDAGGVGPHFDSYDVFLLQAHGQRRWKIGAQQDLTIMEGMPLKILKDFKPQQEFVLEPGDMLYLPPHYAHDGVAVGECMTYSIGFRAPSYQELGESFLQFMAESIELPGRYADPDLTPQKHPAEISKAMLEQVANELHKIKFAKEDIAVFLGEYLSEPKPNVFFDSQNQSITPAKFAQRTLKNGVALSRKTQMLYQGKFIFINGESFMAGPHDKAILHALADQRRLDSMQIKQASEDVLDALYTWHKDGWLIFS